MEKALYKCTTLLYFFKKYQRIKGDLTICDNSRGVTLISIPSKIFRKVFRNIIRDGVDTKLREEQAGFGKGSNTLEQLFILRDIVLQLVKCDACKYKRKFS